MKNILLHSTVFLACSFFIGSLHAAPCNTPTSAVLSPKMGSTVTTRTPVVMGIMLGNNGKPLKNKLVTLTIQDKNGITRPLATLKTDNLGVFSYILNDAQQLSDGSYFVQASVKSCAAATSCAQGTFFYVKFDESRTSCKSGNVDPANSAIVFPFEGCYTNSATPIVVGTLLDSGSSPVSGETVTVKIDSSTIGSPVSNSNGVFSVMASSLSDGAHTADAHCVQTSVDLTTINFTVDTVAPSAPTITTPTENETVNTSLVTIGGTTEANASITTYMDGDTFGDICYDDGFGNWSIDYELDNNTHSVTAEATDLAGNTGSLSSTRHFTVDA